MKSDKAAYSKRGMGINSLVDPNGESWHNELSAATADKAATGHEWLQQATSEARQRAIEQALGENAAIQIARRF